MGLIYVFLWESVITTLFSGLRVFSVRQYTLGLADKISSVNPNVFTARLNGIEAAFLMVIVATIATIYGVRRLLSAGRSAKAPSGGRPRTIFA